MTEAGYLFLLLGAFFSFLGGLGVMRMPDAFNRLQAGTKAVTLGALSVLLGIALLKPEWWSKLLILALFIMITNPVGSSSLARAFHRAGLRPWQKTAAAEQSTGAPRS